LDKGESRLSKRAQASQAVEQEMSSVCIEGEDVALIQLRTSLKVFWIGGSIRKLGGWRSAVRRNNVLEIMRLKDVFKL
jgi:hypothetical protein